MRARAWWRACAALVPLASFGCGLVLGLEDKAPFPDAGVDDGGADANAETSGALDATSERDGGCAPAAPNDPTRCGVPGTCGKSCRGGACVDAACGAATLVTTSTGSDGGTENPLAVEVVGGVVFWSTSAGNVYRCDRDDCAGTRRDLAVSSITPDAGYSEPSQVFALASDATHLYWAQFYGGFIYRTPLAGGPIEKRSANGYPYTLVVDGDNLYWTNFGSGTSSLWRCAKAECFGPADAVFMSDPYVSATPPAGECTEPENRCWYATSLADNGPSLVFIDSKPYPRGEIMSIAKTAADAAVTPSEHDGYRSPTSVTAHAGIVYFTYYGDTSSTGGVMKLQPAFVPLPLAPEEVEPDSLVTDGIDLFWASRASASIRRCAIGGCSYQPTTIAQKQNTPGSLVISDGVLYWVNQSGTEINLLVVR